MIISPAPHIHSGDSVRKKMLNVIIALIPAYLVSLYFFGLGALIVSVTAVAACLFFEWAITKFLLKQSNPLGDLSATLTGLLLAFNLPSNLPIWIIILGAFVAIAIAKSSFGGLGSNLFNPALVGRVFLLISFPVQMTTWPTPEPLSLSYLDANTGATVLSLLKGGSANVPSIVDMLVGNMGGSLGEVSAIALLVGLVYLLATKTITFHIPVSILVSFFVLGVVIYSINPSLPGDIYIQMLSGGLLLGAIFMATDYVTSPMTPMGQIIFGFGIALITLLIRLFGSYPEGMSFAILIMNAVTPMINTYCKPKRFGEQVKKSKK